MFARKLPLSPFHFLRALALRPLPLRCNICLLTFRGLPPLRPFRRAARALASDVDDPPLRPMAASHLRAAFGIMGFHYLKPLGFLQQHNVERMLWKVDLTGGCLHQGTVNSFLAHSSREVACAVREMF
jgi:hypothetical protein